MRIKRKQCKHCLKTFYTPGRHVIKRAGEHVYGNFVCPYCDGEYIIV